MKGTEKMINLRNIQKIFLLCLIPIIFAGKCPEIDGVFYPDTGGDPITNFKKDCNKFKFNRYPGDFEWMVELNGKKDCYRRDLINGQYCAEGKLLNDGKVVITITEKVEYTTCDFIGVYTFNSSSEIEVDSRYVCTKKPYTQNSKSKVFFRKIDNKDKILKKK